MGGFQNITPLNYPELREYRLLARATFILLFAASSLCSIYLDLKNRVRKQIGNYSELVKNSVEEILSTCSHQTSSNHFIRHGEKQLGRARIAVSGNHIHQTIRYVMCINASSY